MQVKKHYIYTLLSTILIILFCKCTYVYGQNIMTGDRKIEVLVKDGLIIKKHLYTKEDGLSNNDIKTVVQDDNGFMWIGTANGLNRFDGKQFKVFNRVNGNLNQPYLENIVKDNNNYLIIQYPGIVKNKKYKSSEVFDIKSQKITPFNTAYPNLPFNPDSIVKICSDEQKIYFLVAPYQVWELYKNNFKLRVDVTKLINPSILKPFNETTTDYIICKKNNILINFDNQKIPLIYVNQKANVVPRKYITDFRIGIGYYIDHIGNLVVNTKNKNGLLVSRAVNTNGDTILNYNVPLQLPKNNIAFFTDELGITEDRNMFVEKKNNHLYYRYYFNYHRAASIFQTIKDEGIINFSAVFLNYYIDKANNLWLCTHKGLIKVQIQKSKFKQYFTSTDNEVKIENQARGIYADKEGNIFANIWDKVYKLDNKNKIISKKLHTHVYPIIAKKDSLYYLSDQFYSSNKNLEFCSNRPKFSTLNIWAFHFISDSEIILRAKPLKKYNLNSQKETNLYNTFFCTNADFFRFTEVSPNKFLGVCSDGIYVFNKDRILNFYGNINTDSKIKIPCNELCDFYKEDNDIFWIATNTEGLIKWDKNNNTSIFFTTANGLPSNSIVRIEKDEFGNLWLATDNGLCKFNTSSYLATSYSTNDGLSHNEFNRISSFKAEDGRMFFGGLNGINAFHPKDFNGEIKTLNEKLNIISLLQHNGYNDKVEDKSIAFASNKEIILQPSDNFFELSFQLLNFQEGDNHFAYKINGVDKDWNYLSGNSVRLSGLPYGKHVITIKAQDNWGLWNKQELNIPLTVIAPFYLKTWFLVLVIVLLILSIYVYVKAKNYKLTKANLLLEKTVATRTQELQSSLNERELLLKELHHRVKNYFSLILSLIYNQAAVTTQEETAKSLNVLHQRITSISIANEMILKKSNAEFTVDKINIHYYLYDLAKAVIELDKRPIELDFKVEEVMLNADTCIPIGILINELITNSIKYAQPNTSQNLTISIYLTMQNNILQLKYNDSGINKMKTNHSNSLGKLIIESMAKQLKGKMTEDNFNYEFILQLKNA